MQTVPLAGGPSLAGCSARMFSEHPSGLFRDFLRRFGNFGAVSFQCGVDALSRLRLATLENSRDKWSERGDLNSRPPVPQTGALTELRYAPKPQMLVRLDIHAQGNETSRSVGRPQDQPLAPTRMR